MTTESNKNNNTCAKSPTNRKQKSFAKVISTTAAPCTTARGYYLRVYNVTHLPYKMATPVNDYYNIAAVIDHASVKFLRNIT